MDLAGILKVALIGAVVGVGTAGCAAPSDDADVNAEGVAADGEGADGEDVESQTQEVSGSCNASLANGAVTAKRRALLDTLAYAEGTRGRGKDGYNVTFAYRYFSSCARHPNMRVCASGYCSTAAGRYQFLTKTWNGLGYSNFGPKNQDLGAMKLISRRGATIPASRAMTATEFSNVMNRVSWEWASLPPGRYGQPSYSMAATRRQYCKFAGC